MNDTETVKDKLIDAQNEILRLRADVDNIKTESAHLIFVTADCRLENKQLRAELAGVRNDYTALADEDDDLGRVNDALVAENAGLRANNMTLRKFIAKYIYYGKLPDMKIGELIDEVESMGLMLHVHFVDEEEE